MKKKSKPEETFALQLLALGLPTPKREYKFHVERRWRIDFAWPQFGVAVEIEGGTYSNGRHTRPRGFEADCEKYNALAEKDWKLFRYTSKMVKDGRAINHIEKVLRERHNA